MTVYAVKIRDRWWVARKVKARDFSLEYPDQDVWSEIGTTAFLGYVGNDEKVVELEAG